MDFITAKNIVSYYINVLSSETNTTPDIIATENEKINSSTDDILKAFKIYSAHNAIFDYESQDQNDQFYLTINILNEILEPSSEIRYYDEILDVHKKTQKYAYKYIVTESKSRTSHEFYSYIYEDICGVDYEEEYGQIFYAEGYKYNKTS